MIFIKAERIRQPAEIMILNNDSPTLPFTIKLTAIYLLHKCKGAFHRKFKTPHKQTAALFFSVLL